MPERRSSQGRRDLLRWACHGRLGGTRPNPKKKEVHGQISAILLNNYLKPCGISRTTSMPSSRKPHRHHRSTYRDAIGTKLDYELAPASILQSSQPSIKGRGDENISTANAFRGSVRMSDFEGYVYICLSVLCWVK